MTVATFQAPVRTGWRWRYGLLGAIGLIALGFFPAAMTSTVILLVALGFVFGGLRRPAAIVVAILLVDFTIGAQPFIGGVNMRYVTVFMSLAVVIVSLPFIFPQQRRTPGIGRVILPGLGFVFLAGVATANGLTPELLVQAVRYYLFGLLAMVLIVTLVNTPRDAKFVGVAFILVCVASGLTSVLQHYTAWGMPAPSINGSVMFGGRSLGLTESPVKIGSDLVIGGLLIWGLIATLTIDHPAGRPLLVALIVIGVGLYFSYTRSGIYGIGMAVVATVAFAHKRVRKEVILALLLVGPVAMFFLMKDNSRLVMDVSEDDSAASRFVLWNVGMRIALDNPTFGIGYDAWDAVAPIYAADIILPNELLGLGIEDSADDFPVHNDFLRVWLSFGTPALITFAFLHIAIVMNYFAARRRAQDLWLKGASTGGLAAVIGYTINSLFHNYFDMSFAFWIMAGFSVVMLKLATEQQSSRGAVR